ncbi:MAG: NAD(P)/FAD-dependent oxidoreductase [Acidimicrobiia bacterium]
MKTPVVVIGAGIAGVASAYRLAIAHGVDVTLVDPRPPLTLTSDKSTECYRNWWPNQPMVGLMNRSIDLLEDMSEQSGNAFGLSRRGYLFVTAREETLRAWQAQASEISSYGGGDVRVHRSASGYKPAQPHGYATEPDGIDVFAGSEPLLDHFPYLTNEAVGAIHVRRAGWFSAQQLGSWMLDEAKEAGLSHLTDEVTDIEVVDGAVNAVELASGTRIPCGVVVNAAGPLAADVARMVGLDLPLRSEVHLKVAYRDHLGVVPRGAPMLIWSDTQRLDWDDDERVELAGVGRTDLLGEMPVFCHGRPEGGAESPYFLALWEYHGEVREPVWPVPGDDLYPEVVARGLSKMIPGFGRYLDHLPQSSVDGGYYTKAAENRPLIGPAGPAGFHLACGYSGFGVMVAAGGADLVSRHITNSPLPSYADDFLLARYDDPKYLESISGNVESGQL